MRQKYCRSCNKWVWSRRRLPFLNAGMVPHLALSLVTCGLWLPVWIAAELCGVNAHVCPNCKRSCV